VLDFVKMQNSVKFAKNFIVKQLFNKLTTDILILSWIEKIVKVVIFLCNVAGFLKIPKYTI